VENKNKKATGQV